MLEILNPLRDLTMFSVALRMSLAVICGGIIGAEREFKRRPAGFRTHIIICLGACMTTLTSQYMALVLGYCTDLADWAHRLLQVSASSVRVRLSLPSVSA